MKKVLSFILALCIVMTLVPTTFAANTNNSIILPFSTYIGSVGEAYTFGSHSGHIVTDYTYDTTDGIFKYHSSNGALSGWSGHSDTFSGSEPAASNYLKLNYDKEGRWYAFEFYAYKGEHNVEIGYVSTSSGVEQDVYVLNAETFSDVENSLATATAVATIDTKGNSGWGKHETTIKIENDGVHYFIVRGNGSTTGAMYLRYVRPTTEVKYMIYSMSAGAENESIAAGENSQISTNINIVSYKSGVFTFQKYTNSDYTGTRTYKSSDENVAKVDENGLITGVRPGKATITVSASFSGNTRTDTVPVEVTMANPSGISIKNYFPDWKWEVDEYYYDYDLKKIDYSATDGFWRYHSKADGWEPELPSFRTNKGAVTVHHTKADQWYALGFMVPKAGEYKGTLSYGEIKEDGNADRYATVADVYLLDEDEIKNVSNNLIPENAIVENLDFAGEKDNAEKTKDIGIIEFEKAGEYYLIVNSKDMGYSMIYDLSLDGGSGTAYMGATAKADTTALTIGETATITASGYLSDRTAVGTVSNWASSDTAVATVEDGIVTARSAGTATITANVTYNGNATPVKVTLNVSDIPVDKSVTIAVDYIGDGENITVDSDTYKLGDTVEITAEPAPEGKVFRGWVRGSKDNGRLVSTDTAYTFKALTNIYLTAIYTDAAPEEYYAWNGVFLGTTKPAAGSEPVVLGYSFKEWAKNVMSENLTRFVAQYVQESTSYNVTYNGEEKPYKYDDEVTLSSDEKVYWYRDGKLVYYGKEYKFNVWAATEITTSSEGHNLPKIILDTSRKDDNNFMVEYDAAGKQIIEVGILFNSEDDNAPIVATCEEKMSSQRDLSQKEHGQFAAKAGQYTKARGYLIYNDNGTYRVIYAD